MNEISEGQDWWPKNSKYGSWGSIDINRKLESDRWIVDIHNEPVSRDIVMTSEEILEGYELHEKGEIYDLKFMEECSYEEEQQKFLDQLEEIKKQRDKNICHPTFYYRIESPEVAYLHPTDEIVYPIYTESDGYGKFHVWVKDGIYNAGVEIEGRYIGWEDKLYPKIKVYDSIPDCIVEKIIKGVCDEKNKI